MTNPHRVVIVGGGIAGLEVATGLGRMARRDRMLDVTLVDRSLAHVWKPMLHTFAAGTSRPEQQKVGFFAHARRHGYRYQPGTLAGVDRHRRAVTLGAFDDLSPRGPSPARETVLPYDVLVLAIGSRANDFGIAGVAEHCLFIDDLVEAEHFHRRFRQHLVGSSHAGGPLDIAIVGGGATGVELAAELKRALDLLRPYGIGTGATPTRLRLLESGDRLLPAFPRRVSAEAEHTLRQLGIGVTLSATVTRADPTGLDVRDHGRVEAGLTVWAAGVRAPAALDGIAELARSRTGQLVIGPSLQTTADDSIFALGDCASLPADDGGSPVPPTAQAARQQALHFVRHAAAWLHGRAMPPFRFRDRGALVSLADFNGWGTMGQVVFGGGVLRGFDARLAHDLLYRQHQLAIHGVGRGVATWAADVIDHALAPPVRLD